jgi:hypothetical protein
VRPLRIFFVGDVAPFLTTAARRDAFLALGHEVQTLDPTRFAGSGRLAARLAFWTLRTPSVFRFNRALREGAARMDPDLVWIEKGTMVFPRTLRAIRDARKLLVYHNTDDWKATTPLRRLHWRFLLRGLRLYDVHVTSNLHNVREFRELGLPHVHHMELAANPAIPAPEDVHLEPGAGLGGPVGFIGHWEPATEEAILHLLRGGVPVKVYGGGWERARARQEVAAAVQHRFVMGLDYARAIQSFDVNLGIVSKWNRNHTASRTFQIPAQGAFLLHERNEVVTRYFREGEEAEFFGSHGELLAKTRHYLAHPDERRRIAAAGRRRVLESGYFETDRVRELVPALEALLRERREARPDSGA